MIQTLVPNAIFLHLSECEQIFEGCLSTLSSLIALRAGLIAFLACF